jgi:hypothetical protein
MSDCTDDVGGNNHPKTSVPQTDSPVECPYCGFALPTETQHRLHLGLEHYDRLTDAEREAFRDTYRTEEADLKRFRIIALGGVVLLYFGFLLMYALLAA